MTAQRGKARKWEQAIAALLQTNTIAEAAEQAGIGQRTLKRWLDNPDFAEAYRVAKRRLLECAVNRLRRAAFEFSDVLHKVAMNEKAHPGTRAAAASRGLEILAKLDSIEDLERRLAEVEQSLVQRGDR